MTLEEANAKATELNIMFMETSAKAGHNVKSLFKKIAMSLVGMEKENEQSEAQNTSTFFARVYLPTASERRFRDRCDITTAERHTRRIAVSVLSAFWLDLALHHTYPCFPYSRMCSSTMCITYNSIHSGILLYTIVGNVHWAICYRLRAIC